MKLGLFWRKKFTQVHELIRILSPYLDYIIWLLVDPYKFKIIKKDQIKKILIILINESKANVGGDFCTIGVLNTIKEAYPQLDLIVLSDEKTIDVFNREIQQVTFITYQSKKNLKDLQGIDVIVPLSLGDTQLKDYRFAKYLFVPFFQVSTHCLV